MHERTGNGLARYGFLHDAEGRTRRGQRIVAMLRTFYRPDLANLRVLDVGCSAGLIAREVAKHVAFTAGIDTDAAAVAHAAGHVAQPDKLAFACASGEALPFRDEEFDLVMCNHVYEHARDPQTLMGEIARVLKIGGVCWFAGGHTWQLIEPHYRLPLLSLMPRALASLCVRAFGGDERYGIRFLPPWRLPELFTAFAGARMVSADALRDPSAFDLAVGPLRFAPVRAIVRPFARPLAWVAPTQLWLLFKGKRP